MSDTKQEVKTRVIKVIEEVLRVPAEKLQDSSSLEEDLGADSLDRVTLLMALEEEFDYEISDDEAKDLTNVGQIIAFITGKAAEVQS